MLDANLMFSGTVSAAGVVAGQAITATAPSTNVLDMLIERDIGAGSAGLQVHVDVTVAFATNDSLQVAYQTSADNITFVNILLSPVVLLASLVVGAKIFRVHVPPFQQLDAGSPNRYHRLNYIVAGADATTGKVVSYLTGANDYDLPGYNYPRNFTVTV